MRKRGSNHFCMRISRCSSGRNEVGPARLGLQEARKCSLGGKFKFPFPSETCAGNCVLGLAKFTQFPLSFYVFVLILQIDQTADMFLDFYDCVA